MGGKVVGMTLRPPPPSQDDLIEKAHFPWALDASYYSRNTSEPFFLRTLYGKVGAGLVNRGNWCFALSTLQVLMKLPCLVYFSHAHKEDCSGDLPIPPTRFSHPCFLCLFNDLAVKCHTLPNKDWDSDTPIPTQDASKIIRALECLGDYDPLRIEQECVSVFYEQLAGSGGGFFNSSALRCNFLGVPQIAEPTPGAQSTVKLGYGSLYKQVDFPTGALNPPSLLCARTATLVTCGCQGVRCNRNNDTATYLTLPLKPPVLNAPPTPLSDILSDKFAPSPSEACPTCGVPMANHAAIEAPSHVFALFLNRSMDIRGKITTEVAVPQEIDIGPFLYLTPAQIEAGTRAGGKPCQSQWGTPSFELTADLVAMQCHTGGKGNRGHWIAVARELPNGLTREEAPRGVHTTFKRSIYDTWHGYDDGNVVDVDMDSVFSAPSLTSSERKGLGVYERHCLQPTMLYLEVQDSFLVASLQNSAPRVQPPPSTRDLSPHFLLDPGKLSTLESLMATGAPFKADSDRRASNQRRRGTVNIPTRGVYNPDTDEVIAEERLAAVVAARRLFAREAFALVTPPGPFWASICKEKKTSLPSPPSRASGGNRPLFRSSSKTGGANSISDGIGVTVTLMRWHGCKGGTIFPLKSFIKVLSPTVIVKSYLASSGKRM